MSFLKYLDTLRVSESFRSVWIFAESSYKIFELAKKRVYRFTRSDGANVNSNSKHTTKKKRKINGEEIHTESGKHFEVSYIRERSFDGHFSNITEDRSFGLGILYLQGTLELSQKLNAKLS